MAESIKDKARDAGHTISETAKNVGHKIAEGVEQATEWVKEKTGMGTEKMGSCGSTKSTSEITPHMAVIASCGTQIGVVDHLDGKSIKLTKNDAKAGGQHHWLPIDWVSKVDTHVHIKKNSEEAMREWKSDAAACGSCGA